MSDYNKLFALFQRLEPLQKETELIGKGLDGAALNETRNATYHLLKALNDSKICDEEIKKAENHANRAIYDCYEAMLLNQFEKLRVFQEDYKTIMVTEVVPNYIEMCKKANTAKDAIINVRKSCENAEKYSPDRNKLYQDIAPFLDEIKDINQDLGHARSELNKIIEDKNIEKKSLRNARIFNAVLLIVAIGAWLYPRAPS